MSRTANNRLPHERLNELERDDRWQRAVFDRVLAPVLRQHSFQNQIVFIDIASPVASMLQRRAHIDAVAQTPTAGMLSLEFKIVRWPGSLEGRPSRHHWSDMFLETWSCSVPGHEAYGWMATCKAEILLWCQCSLDERSLACFPFSLNHLRHWARANYSQLPDRVVANPINGRPLWTRGKLARIQTACRDLKVEGFRACEGGLVTDLFGAPILSFLRGAA